MTVAYKAKELKNKFTQFVRSGDPEDWQQDSRLAKQCALICVDEILLAIDWHDHETPNKEIQYWNDVKEFINKL